MRTSTDETQRCIVCKEYKQLTEFHKDKTYANNHRTVCKSCRSIHRRISRITNAHYDSLLQDQNSSCAICGIHTSETQKGLVVDHNYETRTVRGLLCNNCNVALGLLQDSVIYLSSAIEYLQKHSHND